LSQVTQETGYRGRPDVPGIWHRPGWLRAPMLALGWSALVVYGSLLPFGFDLTGLTGQAGGVWACLVNAMTSPAWIASTPDTSSLGVPAWASDLVLNLALYLPLGVLLRLTASRATGRQWAQIACAGAAVLSMSWLLESAQSLIPGRYASLQDIVLNTTGGLLGVLIGHRVNRLWHGGAFAVYRLTARRRRSLNLCLQTRRGRVLTVSALVGAGTGLVALGYLVIAPAVGGAQAVGAVPFQRYFQRSYDVGVLLLGQMALVYFLAGAMLLLPVMRGRSRWALVCVAMSVSVIAVAVEGFKPMTLGTSADATDPMIALVSGGLVLTLGFMLVNACRRSCRRRHQTAVPVDRRGHRHDYRFAIRPDKTG
jgi:VanZ family protein